MAYLPQEYFKPLPIQDDEQFWKYCSQHELRFQACADCGALRHPPTPICWSCQSVRTTWKKAPETGTVFTYTIVHHAADERIAQNTPYVVALIVFPDFQPIKFISNVVCAPEKMHVGMAVTLFWDDGHDGTDLPRFRPADEALR